ncbi:DUF4297 family anti-phage-associated protein [Bacillus paranthracis]|uniref:DUF4297 family anti-phage-associated protein n=1 Tax=Bacillus cereus group TaxID=86661 RepID=UPI0005E2EF3C|nr:DUF4297 family anti-phage-associated protein [Bacillus paranthracis]CKG24372.1 Uncharacterised protein [Bacillus paranthracis]
MATRDAVDTIIGYFYQFDYTISKLLEFKNTDDLITIEGIEDIDTTSVEEETAIQCKYYAKTEYNHSVIAKPIRLMLNHFKEIKDSKKSLIQYYLYGHYKQGQEKLALPITVEYLKQHFLTYTKDKVKQYHHDNLNLTDEDLQEFISKLSININAVNYDTQLESILVTLQKVFNCSLFEAEHFYYNNALKVIKNLSIQDNIENRKISKQEFLKQINHKQHLFNEWFVLFKNKNTLHKNLRKEYFTFFNVSPFERFFLIEIDNNEYSRSELKDVLLLISTKWSKLSPRTPTPFCPYVYVHNLPNTELIEIKNEFIENNYKFVDGYSFEGARFSVTTISESATVENQIKLKIINNLDDLDLTINHIRKIREIYQFYKNSNSFFDTQDANIKHVKIQYQELKDIKEII